MYQPTNLVTWSMQMHSWGRTGAFLFPQRTSISFRYLPVVFWEVEPLAYCDTNGNVKVRTGHEVCGEGFSVPLLWEWGSKPQPVLSPR